MQLKIMAFLAFLLYLAPTAFAESHHTRVRLYDGRNAAEATAPLPAAVEITLDAGWDTYWRTPGDAGVAPAFNWSGSRNLKNAAVRFPVPERIQIEDLETFGYKKAVTFPLDITPEKKGEAVHLALKLDILICKQICVPESHTLTLDMPADQPAEKADAQAYAAAINNLPENKVEGFSFQNAHLAYDNENKNYLIVTVQTPEAPSKKADLFVENEGHAAFGKPQISYDKAAGLAEFKMLARDNKSMGDLTADLSKGKLTLTYTDDDVRVEGTINSLNGSPSETAGKAPSLLDRAIFTPQLPILLLAFLGGLILNLMPCVLPVLSLKVLSVISHGGKDSRKAIFKNFMASALGIITSFWLMAGILIGMKAAGETIGWGIQFQNPAFLVFLIFMVLIFAANMWGFFEIYLPRFIARNIPAKHAHEPTMLGHFLTGAFATLLATPCTAPFLGTAVSFALTSAAPVIFVVFTMIGIGLASPYMLLAVSPRLFKHMPKPGKWMVKVKKALAVILLITAAWLINVLVTISTTSTLDEGWEAFDEALIAPAVADGKVVMVDVTADWCLTCKANKRLVLDQSDIVDALSGNEIVRLQADWTQRDEKISAFLKKHGRYGIPFNIIYGPAAPEGIALPELLSKKDILEALSAAAGE